MNKMHLFLIGTLNLFASFCQGAEQSTTTIHNNSAYSIDVIFHYKESDKAHCPHLTASPLILSNTSYTHTTHTQCCAETIEIRLWDKNRDKKIYTLTPPTAQSNESYNTLIITIRNGAHDNELSIESALE